MSDELNEYPFLWGQTLREQIQTRERYMSYLMPPLNPFKTIVAGGVRSGTAAVAGDLQEQLGPRRLRTVGYTRQAREPAEPPDARYTDLRVVDEDVAVAAVDL